MYPGTNLAQRSRRRSAFTLIEVLLVLIILVVLGSLAVNQFSGIRDSANEDAVRSQISLVESSMEYFNLHMNRYPSQLEDLWEEPSDSTLRDKWRGPYMEKLGLDPWGNPYQYLAEGKNNPDKYDFWSYGSDGKNGTEDDIGNWDTEG